MTGYFCVKYPIHLAIYQYTVRVNLLAPGKFKLNFRLVIFKQILVIDGWAILCEIALIWVSQDFTDDQSTLVQVMAWCRQATSHNLSQCWPRSLSPYGVSRPQWVNEAVNTMRLKQNGHYFADDIWSWFLYKNFRIAIQIALKFVPKSPIESQYKGIG